MFDPSIPQSVVSGASLVESAGLGRDGDFIYDDIAESLTPLPATDGYGNNDGRVFTALGASEPDGIPVNSYACHVLVERATYLLEYGHSLIERLDTLQALGALLFRDRLDQLAEELGEAKRDNDRAVLSILVARIDDTIADTEVTVAGATPSLYEEAIA